MNSRNTRNIFVYALIGVAVLTIIFTALQPSGSQTLPLGTLIQWAQEGKVQSIEVQGEELTVQTFEGIYTSHKEPGTSVVDILAQAGVQVGTGGVQVEVVTNTGFGTILGFVFNFLPLIFLGLLLLFIMRQAQGSSNQTLNFGRTRAKMLVADTPTVTFDDVAGVEESKQELQEIVEFLRFPERFASLGARIPRGVLLLGPPGTGKTLLAKAVAGEAGVPFFSLSGSEFVEMFVGVGAARVRDLFDQAKKNAPCIMFVDEIDAVGRHRGAGLGGGHDEREQTLKLFGKY